MTSPTPEQNDELARLSTSIDKLNSSTVNQMVRQARMSRFNRKLIWGLAVSMGLDIIVTVLLGVGFHRIDQQARDLDEVTARLDNAQSEQRQKGLCPLYTLFYELTDTPEERAAGKKRSANPGAYDASIKIIHDGYRNLRCETFKGDAPSLPNLKK